VEQSGLARQFLKPKLKITAFVPTNEAFAKLAQSVGYDKATLDDKSLIKRMMALHIINQPLKAEDFDLGLSVWPSALGGQEIRVVKDDDGNLRVGPYKVLQTNILGGKSVMHIIDGFLIAPQLIPNLLEATRDAAAAKAGADADADAHHHQPAGKAAAPGASKSAAELAHATGRLG